MRRVLVLCTVFTTVLSLTIPAIAQPGNDDLAEATVVTMLPYDDVADTAEATTEAAEPVEGEEFCPPRGSTVWYALTPNTSQEVRIDTAGSDYDTTLAVYTGSGYGDLALVDCNDDTFFGPQAVLTMSVEAGATYLIQVGSFGGDGGGELHLSIGEPGSTHGKPIIFKSRFKGLTADVFREDFDETSGDFSAWSANLVDGQSSEDGKPAKSATLFVDQFTESIDEGSETYTVTEWFGATELGHDQYSLDSKLRSAWVTANVVLEGQTCIFGFEEEEFMCDSLGSAEVTVDLSWDGFGGISKSKFHQQESMDGIRFMSRGKLSSRPANINGGWTGELDADLTGSFGSLTSQSSGNFVMIRGAGLP